MTSFNQTVATVLSDLLGKSGLSESDLASKIDVPRSTINRITLGKTPDPRASTLSLIAAYFSVSIEQVMGLKPILSVGENPTNLLHVPLIDWSSLSKAGDHTSKNLSKYASKFLFVEKSMVSDGFSVPVKGDAMAPDFQEGSTLVVDTTKMPKNKDFVISMIGESDEPVFRQLISEGSYGILSPINELFPSFKIDNLKSIIGVVRECRREIK